VPFSAFVMGTLLLLEALSLSRQMTLFLRDPGLILLGERLGKEVITFYDRTSVHATSKAYCLMSAALLLPRSGCCLKDSKRGGVTTK
jgi:hypothetical protein